MIKQEGKRLFDLEDRTFKFAKAIGVLNKEISGITMDNGEYLKRLVRSSGSVAANYVEANESFGKKDFRYRLKICRKEAKESRLWLKLLNISEKRELLLKSQENLIQEALELIKIFNSILEKTK